MLQVAVGKKHTQKKWTTHLNHTNQTRLLSWFVELVPITQTGERERKKKLHGDSLKPSRTCWHPCGLKLRIEGTSRVHVFYYFTALTPHINTLTPPINTLTLHEPEIKSWRRCRYYAVYRHYFSFSEELLIVLHAEWSSSTTRPQLWTAAWRQRMIITWTSSLLSNGLIRRNVLWGCAPCGGLPLAGCIVVTWRWRDRLGGCRLVTSPPIKATGI